MLKKLAHIGASLAIGAIVAAFAAQSSLHSASAASKAAAINDAERVLGFQVTTPAKRLHDVRFTDAEGALVTLKDKRGTVVLINFWATWCPPCVHEMPSLERLQTKLGNDGFEVLAINEDREDGVIGPAMPNARMHPGKRQAEPLSTTSRAPSGHGKVIEKVSTRHSPCTRMFGRQASPSGPTLQSGIWSPGSQTRPQN